MKQITQQHMLAKAILIASEGHLDVMDKGGKAYILHPIQVMYNLNTEDPELKQIAILHDVIEDCIKFLIIKKFCETMTLEEASEKVLSLLSNLSQEEKVSLALEILTSWGFSKRVTSALQLMTKLSTDKGEEGYFSTGVGWYLHGELEDDAKFDICACSVNPRTIEEGIHKATYKGDIEATLYCWQIKTGNHIQYRGLIVKNTDIESVNFANVKFENRAIVL